MKHLITNSLLTMALFTFTVGSADATLVWNWSNAGTGTESGTFTTDGDLVGGLATAGTYNVTDFSLDTTSTPLALGSVSGGAVRHRPARYRFHLGRQRAHAVF